MVLKSIPGLRWLAAVYSKQRATARVSPINTFAQPSTDVGLAAPANDLERYFHANTGRLLHKWAHYFAVYDRHFSRYRGTNVSVVEFGVSHGGSLQMWRDYFGPNAKIYGVDINPLCRQFTEEGIEIIIGDQADKRFLRSLVSSIPRIDILIDDGGHTMRQQINTFEVLFSHIAEDGVYLCEDIHSSYWKSFGGGHKRRGTFIEYSKNLIDQLHAWHSEKPNHFRVSHFTQSATSLHYYDSILVIEKGLHERPHHQKSGQSVPGIP